MDLEILAKIRVGAGMDYNIDQWLQQYHLKTIVGVSIRFSGQK